MLGPYSIEAVAAVWFVAGLLLGVVFGFALTTAPFDPSEADEKKPDQDPPAN